MSDFCDRYDAYRLRRPTYAERTRKNVKALKITGSQFESLTGVNANTFSKMCGNPFFVPKLPAILAICRGLGLELGFEYDEIMEWIESSGYNLKPPTFPNMVYDIILREHSDKDYYAANELMRNEGIQPNYWLGSREKRK